MRVLKIYGIFAFATLAIIGITQRSTPGGENNLIAGLFCGAIAIFLFRSLFTIGSKRKKDNSLQTKEDDIIASSSTFQVEFSNHYSDEYLNQVLPNGRTIREEKQKNLEEALSSPDFRTDEEENLIFDFYTEFQHTLTLAEEKLYQLVNDIGRGKTLDERILKVRKVISHYEHLKSFCYSKGLGGQMYFQDMWEHCHNSKNSDFDYIDQFKELLDNWITRREERDEMALVREELLSIIKEKPGILQKELYARFDPNLKVAIRGEMMQLEADGVVRREKHGNTYELYLM